MAQLDRNRIKTRTVAGAVAGNLTVTGIKKADRLIAVQPVNVASAELTDEFRVTADNTINNAGGTSSATQVVLVIWEVTPVGRGAHDTYDRSTGVAI